MNVYLQKNIEINERYQKLQNVLYNEIQITIPRIITTLANTAKPKITLTTGGVDIVLQLQVKLDLIMIYFCYLFFYCDL